MADINEGGNKFLMELKNALRKLNRSREEDEEKDDEEGLNTTSDTLTPGDTTANSFTLNDATMSSTLTLNGDISTETETISKENKSSKVKDSKVILTKCDHKNVPFFSPYDSKATEKGLKRNGCLPGIHFLNNSSLLHSGLKVQVPNSDADTPEGSNASSPKTMSTAYSSDKESGIQRQRSDLKTPSPAPAPLIESLPQPASADRPPKGKNLKVAQADLYNELNSVLKKRNQMTRRSSILELERQKGCKTIVYYGRGGSPSGQLIRKGSITSTSPSPLAAARAAMVHRESLRTDSMSSDISPIDTKHLGSLESHLPDLKDSATSVSVEKSREPTNHNNSSPPNLADKTDKPQMDWLTPSTIRATESKREGASAVNSAENLNQDKVKKPSMGELQARIRDELESGVTFSGAYIDEQEVRATVVDNESVMCNGSIPGSLKLIPDDSFHMGARNIRLPTPDISDTDSIVSKELLDLRKTFDNADARKAQSKTRSPITVGQSVEELDKIQAGSDTTEPKISVEIKWPKESPPSYLHDDLKQWHERLSGKWKNQEEEDDMMDDDIGIHSALIHANDKVNDASNVIPDRDTPSGASESSHGYDTANTPSASALQLPRAALSLSTRERLKQIKMTASAQLFARENKEEERVLREDQYGDHDTEEEKESSIDFTEEIHPGSLVSQLVDRVRGYSMDGWNDDTTTDSSKRPDVDGGESGVHEAIHSSDCSSELSAEGSLMLSGSEHHQSGDIMTSIVSSSPQPTMEIMSELVTQPARSSDMSLTSVTSYDVSLGDITGNRYNQVGGLSSSETLALSRSVGSSVADMQYHAGSIINPQSRSWEHLTSQDSVTDSQGSLIQSPNTKHSKPPNQSNVKNLRGQNECLPQLYAGASTLEGQQQFDKPVFVRVIPTSIEHQLSKGLPDDKVKSLDRILIKKHRNRNRCSRHDSGISDHTHDGSCCNNYATYPPPRSQSRTFIPDDDALTNLMITHSGDPFPPDPISHIKGTSSGDNRQISAHVTVPQPTSFHRHGNNVGGHLINPICSSITHPPRGGSDGFQISSSGTEYESGDNRCRMSDPGHRLFTENDSESGEDCRYHFQKKRIPISVLDKENQRHLLFQTWSSNAAAKKVRDRNKLPHWRRGLRSVHPGEESDSSLGARHNHIHGNHNKHQSECKFSDGHGSSRSMVKSRLLRHVDSFSSCDAPCGEMGFYHQKRDRNYSVTAESIHSACTYIDSQDHSSDGDTESLYQDYEQYEQSLIQYVRTEDLSQINDDIRSLYWQQFDSMSLSGLPGHQKGLLRRLVCCFFCDNNHQASFAGRVASRASSRCPLHQSIQDSIVSAQAYGDGLIKGEEDKTSSFYVDTQGKRGDLTVQCDGPNSVSKVNIEMEQPNGRYLVTYVPVEVGIYSIYINWHGREIPGSPFHPKVVHPNKVYVVGGWQTLLDANNQMQLEVNQMKQIEFDCLTAGPGALSAEVRGPAGSVPCEVEHHASGRYVVRFVPRVQGEHYLSVAWADIPLPRSPFTGFARGDTGAGVSGAGMATMAPPPVMQGTGVNHDKVVLTGRGLQEARVNQEAEFVIDGTEAGPGTPEIKLSGVKSDIDVRVSSLGGNKYRCTYVPAIPGAYLLNIMWSDRQVRGSPFKVNIVASSDASKVVCTGEGLKVGIMGKEIKSVIDTRRAGPGELTAHCMGPHKVAYCELYDHRDGTFTLNVKPQEAGRHVLTIKYGAEQVPGSPFILKISGAPDASKVRVTGPGIEPGILALYQSRFIVETRGAGAGQLTVRIRGPKGAFRVEMQRESQKDRTILCRYDPTEVGDYIIHIKWSGEHVPGSPFRVQIFDTQGELERFMMENPGGKTNTMLTNRSWNAEI